MRTVALLVEIISALAALGCLIALAAYLVHWLRVQRPQRGTEGAWHVKVSLVMCAAAAVHGAAAMAYASGATPAAYALGWAALAAFILSGLVMARPARVALKNPVALHAALFGIGAALVAAHAVAGRL